ncbi:short-chain dehydrogenase/reductase SDR [Fibrisoma limi BUZ 3]|uniref:Short-chain dehydrogenase/reductase SDR n=1 Tax=Fibrisoma limi BUZ 3 TaxID=1185876 RepID=I2GIF7_9BACT|nr:SDR family oxidoreductase [Fibrisoma limi]CCH53682.1 short-chain dehydrogenase/reductase SDR [Fibrisoma limi BUZ 3]
MYQKPNQRLVGQTAIITGASSGIGRACAIALAREGANVVVNYIGNPAGAEEVAGVIQADGGQVRLVQADVSQEEQVQRLFAQTIEAFGTVDILVNNAGLQKDSLFVNMTLEQWRFVLDVNLTGQFLCAREAAREFLRRGPRPDVSQATGKIICMSSVHEFIPWAGHANYAASKGGVMLLMKSIAQELGEYKVRVNSVAPGAIRTPINRMAWETPQSLNHLLKLIPYKRIGETSDIGAVVAWLASDEADYIHGQTIVVDGGMALYPGFEDNG